MRVPAVRIMGLLLASYGYVVLRGEDHLAQLDKLVSGVVFMDWFFFSLCGLALLKLRRAGGHRQQFGGDAVSVSFTLLAIAITVGAIWTQGDATLAGSAIGACGLLAFWWMRRQQRAGS